MREGLSLLFWGKWVKQMCIVYSTCIRKPNYREVCLKKWGQGREIRVSYYLTRSNAGKMAEGVLLGCECKHLVAIQAAVRWSEQRFSGVLGGALWFEELYGLPRELLLSPAFEGSVSLGCAGLRNHLAGSVQLSLFFWQTEAVRLTLLVHDKC